MAADKFSSEDARHLMEHFEKWLAQKYGQPAGRQLSIGGIGMTWRVDYGSDQDYNHNYGVSLQINAPGKRAQRKLQRSLKSMQRRVEENVDGVIGSMKQSEIKRFEAAEEAFVLGYCAMRMKRELLMDDSMWNPSPQVRGTVSKEKQGWIRGVRYHKELDTLIVPALRRNGTDYFIPLEQSDVIWATVMTEHDGKPLK